jgi:hypothetical protein
MHNTHLHPKRRMTEQMTRMSLITDITILGIRMEEFHNALSLVYQIINLITNVLFFTLFKCRLVLSLMIIVMTNCTNADHTFL